MELSVLLSLVAGTDRNCAMSGDCSGCTIGDDDTENSTGGTSSAGTPVSDGLVLSLSAIESLRMPIPEALTSPSTEELLRWPALFFSIVSIRLGRIRTRRSMGISPSPG